MLAAAAKAGSTWAFSISSRSRHVPPSGIRPIVDTWMRDPCLCGPRRRLLPVGTGTTGDWKCDGIPL